MQSDCLAFSDVPHTTPLFIDFLSWAPRVQSFYPRPPQFSRWLSEQAGSIRYEDQRRMKVADILERQNRAWGASAQSLENIARFRAGATSIVTGQQVGLFGGPLFTIFKAVSAVCLAAEARSAGFDCIPLFWLATEDHDFEEINHATLLNSNLLLQLLRSDSERHTDAPISAIRLGNEITGLVEEAANLLGDSEAIEALRDSYRAGERFGDAFARLLAKLFARWGVVMLDASDPELHTIAAPLYAAAVERARELDEALLRRGKELVSAGYHEQVKVTAKSTLLFALHEGARTSVHLNGQGGFRIANHKLRTEDLLERVKSEPENFSANVLLRPVVQDYLLPTLAYIGGPAEVAYFAQAGVVYEKLLGHVTPILPRFSATLIEPKLQKLLQRYRIELKDLFHGFDALREKLAEHSLPPDLHESFDNAEKSLAQSLASVRAALERLDPTLVKAAERAASKMHYQLGRLRGRAARAQTLRSEIVDRHTVQLSSALFPRKALQEREIAGIYFLARHGTQLLDRFYAAAESGCPEHQVLYL